MAYLKPFNIDGSWQEVYTPSANRIVSPSLGQKLEAALFFCTAVSNITIITYAGNTITLASYPAYTVYPFPVTAITASSAGSIIIVHDGQEAYGED